MCKQGVWCYASGMYYVCTQMCKQGAMLVLCIMCCTQMCKQGVWCYASGMYYVLYSDV